MSDELPGLALDRIKRGVAAFVRELFPTLDYFRPHLYVVADWDYDSQTGSLVPAASAVGRRGESPTGSRSPPRVASCDGRAADRRHVARRDDSGRCSGVDAHPRCAAGRDVARAAT